jgi:hypothetical protein
MNIVQANSLNAPRNYGVVSFTSLANLARTWELGYVEPRHALVWFTFLGSLGFYRSCLVNLHEYLLAELKTIK